jgi:hypothetical protein
MMPGVAPKPVEQRRRRNAPLANTVKLPAEGRAGAAPPWPLTGRAPSIWAGLWATPQAAAWEKLGWTRIVARYTRILLWCENPKQMTSALLAEARQLEDRLGLTPMAMLRLRWEIASDELAEKREPEAPARPRRALRIASAVEA